jgi:hypothetical protein
MKIGVMSRGSPDYLIDIVADGLSRLFGIRELSFDYVSANAWSDSFMPLRKHFAGSRSFDLKEADVLVASVRSLAAADEWLKATGKKVVMIDGEDDPFIREPWPSRAAVYFKREYLKGRSYPPNIRPLPFAAIPEEVPEIQEATNEVFFMAHESHPFRREVANALHGMGHQSKERMEKDGYNKLLASSRIGVSVRGAGWDTYRYWETPYMGAALLSQRLGIVVPDDFKENEEAVYFETVDDFETKLKRMLSDKKRTEAMRMAGRRACMERHLSTHRARTVIDAIS